MIYDYYFRVVVEDTPAYYYWGIQTDEVDDTATDPSNPGLPHRDFVIVRTRETQPESEAFGMTIHTDVGSAIVDDQTVVTSDPDNVKYFLVSVIRDDASGDLEILVREKILGNYAEIASDKTLEYNIDEYLVVANGDELVKM